MDSERVIADAAKRDLRSNVNVLADLAERVSNIVVDMPSMVFSVLGEIARLEAENERLSKVAEAGRALYEVVTNVNNMGYNRFYRTPMFLEQHMTLEDWEVVELNNALAAYEAATE